MLKTLYTFEIPCNGLTKGFPEIGKRLTECDIPNKETSYHPRLPHPLPNGATCATLRQVIFRLRGA